MSIGSGGDIETRFTTIFGQQGMEVYDQFIELIRKLKEEQQQLIEVSLRQKNVDADLIAQINGYNQQIAKAEAALKGLTRASLDDIEATKRLAAAKKEAAEEQRAADAIIKAERKALADAEKQAAKEEADAAKAAAKEAAEAEREKAAAKKEWAAAYQSHLKDVAAEEAAMARANAEVNQAIEQSDRAMAANAAAAAEARHQQFVEEQRLAEFEANEAHNKQARANQQAKDIANVERQERALDAAIEEMAQHEATAARATVATADATTKAGKATDEATQKQRAMNRLLYMGSQALQDVQYGMASISNNMPLLALEGARAFGGNQDAAMKWGAAMGIVAVALEALSPLIKKMYDDLAGGDYEKAHSALETLHHSLQKIKSEQWIVHVDSTQVDALEEAARRAKDSLEAFNRAKGERTVEQQEAGRRVFHAVVESAGGTDKRSGTQNIAEAIGDYREAHPEAFAADKAKIAEINKLQGEAKSFREALDAGNLGEDTWAVQHEYAARIAQIDKIRKAMRADDEALVGGALRGDEGDIARLQGMLNAAPGVFGKRGIGEQFRKEIASARREIVAGDPEVQERLAKATPEGRDEFERQQEAEREFERTEIQGKEREGKGVSKAIDQHRKKREREADELTAEGRRVEKLSDALVERQAAEAAREHDQEVNRLARQVDAAIKRDKRLDLSVGRAIANRAGQSPEEIAEALSGVMAQLLQGNRAIPETAKAEVGRAVLLNRARAGNAAIGASGEEGVGARFDDQAVKLDRADRLAEQRQADEANRAALMQQYQGHGANGQQAQAMTNRAIGLIHQGLNFDQAMLTAWGEMQNRLAQLEGAYVQLRNDFNHAHQRGQRARSALPLGRRR